MKTTFADIAIRFGNAWDRGVALAKRHPVQATLLLPTLAILYVLALVPFTPSIGDIKKARLEQPTVVLTADGKELATFKRANRDWVKLDEISPNVINALIATEDRRFYDHIGLDFKRTASAAIQTLTGDRQGGSTITQQLARNLYPEEVGREASLTRKLKEAITALKIEAIYSKPEILETYLNTVPFLYNAFGIEMAARTYFDKPARQLDVLESATLIGMLKGTSYYNPVLNPERAVQRRNTVLAQLVKSEKLPADQFEGLAKKPLRLDFERQPEFSGPAPHLAQNIKRWLIDWADQHDYDINRDGLVVRTSIDSRLQSMANEAVVRQGHALQKFADREWARYAGNRELMNAFIRERPEFSEMRSRGVSEADALAQLRADDNFMQSLKREKSQLQAGFLALDPMTGQVRAWVGSRDFQTDKFDHVAQARRQPGSTFKPFVYGAAFDSGMRPTDTFIDGPVEIRIDRNKVWRPGDVDGTTNLPMSLRDGLVKSKNSITAQVVQQVGASRVAQLARAMGVRQSHLDEVPSIALGTSPVSLREMVTAYATIANGGAYIEPIVVTSIEDRNGRVLEQFHARAPERAMSPEASQTLLDVMRGVIDEGTGVGLRPRYGLQGDLAGKTGTTQNNTDGWFILMHPQLVGGAWVGFNDSRLTMRDEWGQGARNALLVVGDTFQQAQKAKLVDVRAKFAAPKDMSKQAPAGGELWGRMGDWWNSVFPGGQQTAAVPAVSVPEVVVEKDPAADTAAGLPAAQRVPDVSIAEPMRLPDTGVVVAPSTQAQMPPQAQTQATVQMPMQSQSQSQAQVPMPMGSQAPQLQAQQQSPQPAPQPMSPTTQATAQPRTAQPPAMATAPATVVADPQRSARVQGSPAAVPVDSIPAPRTPRFTVVRRAQGSAGNTAGSADEPATSALSGPPAGSSGAKREVRESSTSDSSSTRERETSSTPSGPVSPGTLREAAGSANSSTSDAQPAQGDASSTQ